MYTSQETAADANAFFDNLSVTYSGALEVTRYADYYPFGSVLREAGSQYRFGFQGGFAEKDEETGWNAFKTRMYDPILGRWLIVDPQRQFASQYLGMGNSAINGVDPDGEAWHILAGAIIGGGITAYSLYKKGELEWSWRAAGKIAVGAGTGALIAAVPAAAISSVGQFGSATILGGIYTETIGGALLAGTIAGTGSVIDQTIDVHPGHASSVNYTDAAINGGITGFTLGLGGQHFANLRYASRLNRWAGTNSSLSKFIDKAPNFAAVLLNSSIDLSRAGLENFFRQNTHLVYGETPWGFYVIPRGQELKLPEIIITPDSD